MKQTQGREPNKSEKIYIKAVLKLGCLACRKLGRETDGMEEYTSFHHNPEKGSLKPLAHFFGYGLCPYHHQGTVPPGCENPKEPVRHVNETRFEKSFGTDLAMAQYAWESLSLDTVDNIGLLSGIYSFDQLLGADKQLRS